MYEQEPQKRRVFALVETEHIQRLDEAVVRDDFVDRSRWIRRALIDALDRSESSGAGAGR